MVTENEASLINWENLLLFATRKSHFVFDGDYYD